jgi:hypothetical protein
MSGQINKQPEEWSVKGNIAPEELSNAPSSEVFDLHNCSITLLTPVTVEGRILTPLRINSSF